MKTVTITVTDDQFNFLLSIMNKRSLKNPAKVVESLIQAVVEQSKDNVLIRTPRQRNITTLDEIETLAKQVKHVALEGIQLVKKS